jgi:hypothetical protein
MKYHDVHRSWKTAISHLKTKDIQQNAPFGWRNTGLWLGVSRTSLQR